MLKSLEIQNYRGFERYQMADLARVNLLVGKNNSGKTALLEGIQFLTSHGDPAVLAEVAERRGEVIVRRDSRVRGSVDIARFFHGHALAEDNSFSFRGDNGYPIVTARIQPAREAGLESHVSEEESSRPEYILRICSPAKAEHEEPRFAVSREGGVELENRVRRSALPRSGGPRLRFVGPESVNTVDLAVMWDEVTLSGQEIGVAEALRVLDPNVESIHFLTGMLASGYFPARGGVVVGLKGQETRVPLGSLGDGMRRMMALAASLAFTAQGCLFVDEIDTGLHYSVMSRMWKLVVAKAMQANVQVFATTHSWDCIAGLSALCLDEPELMSQVAIHKIDPVLPHSVAFSGKALVRMVKSDIDPR